MSDNEQVPPNNNNVSKPGSLPHGLLEQILQNQVKELELKSTELELKSSELELQKQQDANSLDFAKTSLAAHERDRKHARDCEREKMKDRYKLVGAIAIGLLLLVVVAVLKDKDVLAIEIVKAIAYISAGAVGGYAAGRLRAGSGNNQQSDGDS